MKKAIMICTALILILTGCQEKSTTSEPSIYYLNANRMDVLPTPYSGALSYGEAAVKDMLEVIKNPSELVEGHTPFVKDVQVERIHLEGTNVNLYFNTQYEKLDVVEEVLLRASVVQSLLKIKDLESVTIYVADTLLEDAQGVAYGPIRAEDFVQNVGSAIHSYQTQALSLYFADESGTQLVKEIKNVRHNSNTSMEKVVVERMMEGTNQSYLQSTIAQSAKLLGVTVKEDICYVNFDDGIQEVVEHITPEVLLYSIVNSLIENGIASQVQISINGESTGKLLGSISLEKPFEANWELVQK